VLLFGLADKKTVNVSAGYGNGDNNGIRPHGQPADRLRLPAPGPYFFQKYLAAELRPAGIESRRSAIDVVVTRATRGKLELSQAKRLHGEQTQQFLTRRRHEFLRYQQIAGSRQSPSFSSSLRHLLQMPKSVGAQEKQKR